MKINFLLLICILCISIWYVDGARRKPRPKPNKTPNKYKGPVKTRHRYLNVLPNVATEEEFVQTSATGAGLIDINPTIVNGIGATTGQFPFAAALFLDGWFCSSSLIHPQWILTAAHCTKGVKSITAFLGSVDYTNVNRILTMTTTKFIHASYNEVTLNNDISLIKLKSPLAATHFTSGKLAVSRLPTDAMATMTFVGTVATACGWGLTKDNGTVSKNLNYAEMPVIPNANCSAVFGTAVVIASVLCTNSSTGSNVCSGDSGGPLLIKESDGMYTQIGIVSFGASKSCFSFPSGFTRITSFGEWIKQTTGGVVSFRPAKAAVG